MEKLGQDPMLHLGVKGLDGGDDFGFFFVAKFSLPTCIFYLLGTVHNVSFLVAQNYCYCLLIVYLFVSAVKHLT